MSDEITVLTGLNHHFDVHRYRLSFDNHKFEVIRAFFSTASVAGPVWKIRATVLLDRGMRILRMLLICDHTRDARATFVHGSSNQVGLRIARKLDTDRHPGKYDFLPA